MSDIPHLTPVGRRFRINPVVRVSAMTNNLKTISVSLAVVALLSLPLLAQQQSQPQDQDQGGAPAIPQNQKLTKEQKQKMKKTLKELDTLLTPALASCRRGPRGVFSFELRRSACSWREPSVASRRKKTSTRRGPCQKFKPAASR